VRFVRMYGGWMRPEVLVRLNNSKAGTARQDIWIELVPHPRYGHLYQVRARAGHARNDWWMRTNSPQVAIDKARQIVEADTTGTWRDWSNLG